MQLFYSPEITNKKNEFAFSKEESRHIVKVLRKQEEDALHITNGLGDLFTAQILHANPKQCVVKIISNHKEIERPYHLHIAIAPTKMNDRFEWFLEKATEIGIDSITPIICNRSERKIIKADRFEKVLQSAMKQSLSSYLPKLNDIMTFKEFVHQEHKGDLFIAHCEDSHRKSLKKELKANQSITVLIGPEGDFSTEEIEIAIENKYLPVTLGNTRLRTETAGIVACHTTALINEL